MLQQKVIIIGSSGHAKVVIDCLEKAGQYSIIGLIDRFRDKGETTSGYSVLGGESDLPLLLETYPGSSLIIAIGDNHVRKTVYDNLLKQVPGCKFANAIHPSAQIGKDVTLGVGVVVFAGAVVNSGSIIGDFVILNTRSSADHDCRLNDFSSLAPGVTLGGRVQVGTGSAVSIGSVVRHNILIGDQTIVGAGSLVIKDCRDHSVYYGSPAEFIRSRIPGDQYL